MGEKGGGNQQHHHHHHHHHKNVHHHHHGHQHSHGHNHNHDHKHDHDHKHGHNHNHGHNHDHKHAHGHKHQHNHDHGHQHKHGHLHGHKHAHILLHRQLHGHRQIHSHGPIYQQGHHHNNNYGSNKGQHHIKGDSYEQHHVSHHSNQFPPIKQQQHNKYTSNNHHHNNLQHSNYATKYPDHVPPSYVSTDRDKGIYNNEDHNNVQKEHKFKVHYDESEKDDVQQSHYEHSASNENASYEPNQEDNHNAQDENSHSSENPPDSSAEKYKEDVNKGVSSSEIDGASPRFSHDKLSHAPLTPQSIRAASPRIIGNPRFRNSNIPNDHDKAHRLKGQENSDELVVEPQVRYGVRLGQNGYNDYQKKEASISTVSFLQENGEIVTVGDDDPFVSVGRPMTLEDANPEESYHGESLESKLSAGRMTLTTARDYKASIGKIDEVFNIPLFD